MSTHNQNTLARAITLALSVGGAAIPAVSSAEQPDLIATNVTVNKLEVDWLKLSGSLPDNLPFNSGNVQVTIGNLGEATEESALVTVFQDTNHNGVFDNDVDETLGFQPIPTDLQKGVKVTIDVPIKGNINLKNNIYTMLDSEQHIDEANEDNNYSSIIGALINSLITMSKDVLSNKTLSPIVSSLIGSLSTKIDGSLDSATINALLSSLSTQNEGVIDPAMVKSVTNTLSTTDTIDKDNLPGIVDELLNPLPSNDDKNTSQDNSDIASSNNNQLAILPTVADTATPLDTIWLDTYSPADKGFAGPAISNIILKEGISYLVKVKGTYSVWVPGTWQNPKGQPEQAPLYLSSNTNNGKVGADGASIFAHPSDPLNGAMPIFFGHSHLKMSWDGANNWLNPTTIEKKYKPDHAYAFNIEGKNHALKVRFNDHPTHDNYGQFKIQIYPTCRAFGKVLDKYGDPIANVTIQANVTKLAGNNKTIMSDVTGYWEITGLPENDYTLTANKDGYRFDSTDFFVGNQDCNVDLKTIRGESLLKVKVVPSTWDDVKQGENLTYTITVSNEGSETATDVTLQDVLPEGTTLVSIKTLDGGSCEADTLNCNLPDLTPGATANVEVIISNTQAGQLVNAVTVNANEYPAEIQKTWKTVKPYLSVSITDMPDPVTIQGMLHYKLAVELNHYAPTAATGIKLISHLPRGVELEAVNTDYGVCETDNFPTITCILDDLSIDSADSISYVTIDMDVRLLDPGLLLLTHEAKIAANEYPAHTDREHTEVFIGDVEVDMVFVIDDSNSMQEEINGVIRAIKQAIAKIDPNTTPFIALVTFKDDVTVRAATTDLQVLLEAVSNIEVSGGGMCPEASVEALEIATKHIKKGGAILFSTDASPYDNADIRGLTERLRSKGVKLNAILSGDCTNKDSWNGVPQI